MGARPTKNGVSGVHTHMTNSLNTPAEALEYAYPIRLRQYSLRPNSGGVGLHAVAMESSARLKSLNRLPGDSAGRPPSTTAPTVSLEGAMALEVAQ